MARNDPDWSGSCPFSGVFLPRRVIAVAAVDDPQRHFVAVN
jgi:hypothetical protein